MSTNPKHSGRETAEGSRETIDHELRRASQGGKPGAGTVSRSAPGNEAMPGTPGTGEDVCPECRGSGKKGATACPNCDGSGRIVKAIGGA